MKRQAKIKYLKKIHGLKTDCDLMNELQERGEVSDNAETIEDVAECDLDDAIDNMD